MDATGRTGCDSAGVQAWGCGAFGNDPRDATAAFGRWLDDPGFGGAFDRVVFAVYDGSRDRANLRAFEERFAGRGRSPS